MATKKVAKKASETKKTAKTAKTKTAKAAPKKTKADATKPLTKSQIVAHFSDKFALSKAQTTEILDELVTLSAKEAKRAGAFTLPGLGKLTLAKRKARMGRNPATGEAIKIPAKTVVKMRLSKSFTESVVPPKKAVKKK